MFEYEICNVFDSVIFNKQCNALLEHIPGLKITNDLEDVDGTQIRTFATPSQAELSVFNDVEFGVYIKSSFDIRPYFMK
jgi:hypothetical protein